MYGFVNRFKQINYFKYYPDYAHPPYFILHIHPQRINATSMVLDILMIISKSDCSKFDSTLFHLLTGYSILSILKPF